MSNTVTTAQLRRASKCQIRQAPAARTNKRPNMLDHGRGKRKTKPYPALWSATAHYSRPRRAGSRPGLGPSGPWLLYCASRCLPTWFGLTTYYSAPPLTKYIWGSYSPVQRAASGERPIHSIPFLLHDIRYSSYSTPPLCHNLACNDGRSFKVICNSIRSSNQDSFGQTQGSGRSPILSHLPGIDHGPTSDEHVIYTPL